MYTLAYDCRLKTLRVESQQLLNLVGWSTLKLPPVDLNRIVV